MSIADRIRAIARNGQFYASNEYDKERYDELLDLSNRLTATLTATEIETVAACYTPATDYVTPKVDIRAVVFDDNERILLVRERADGKWSLPGGWGDIGFSPGEVAIKELREECPELFTDEVGRNSIMPRRRYATMRTSFLRPLVRRRSTKFWSPLRSD